MEALVMLLVGVLLLTFAIVWAARGMARRARRLVGKVVTRARPVDGKSVGQLRWLVDVAIEGHDAKAMHSALSGFILTGELVGSLIESRLRRAVKGLEETPTNAEEFGRAIEPGLRAAFAEDGFRLANVRALGNIDLTQPELVHLSRYELTECYRVESNMQLRCTAADLYLDGLCGHGNWSVDCAPRPGAIMTRLTSVEILKNRDHIMEVSIDGRSIVSNRSIAQMLRGE